MRDIWAAMAGGEVLLGHWVTSGSPAIVEALGHAGADFVAIDCEHGPVSPYGPELEACLRAADAGGMPAVVRIASHDGTQVMKAADSGAAGVVVPHVNHAEELAALLRHARFPPAGDRGCHPAVRAARYGHEAWAAFARRSDDAFAVVPLLEEPAAFEHLDQILDVDGLRAVAFGGFDLAARLGGVGDAAAQARVDELLARLLEGCDARGLSVIDGAWDGESARRKIAAGCRGVLCSTDIGLLLGAIREHFGDVRAGVPGGVT